ncbi:unnamed protein product [Thelazia callipaeda]|uniref:Protein kinase domain-containing protein n=1 Tax=Thelazia callipaeda TaxID=103827 RepID=A0A0N5CMD3_THECL|nr:unnamed protein product [Thelazia callipaeda]
MYCTKYNLKHTYRVVAAGHHDTLKIQYLVTKCYGLSIADQQSNQPDKRFSKPTCLKLGLRTLKCLQQLHEIGFIHRDIKPQVFVTDATEPQNIYIVHFGLARRFRTRECAHLPRRPSLALLGAVKYISRNAHKRNDRSQCDDIESWFYVLIEMFNRELLTWTDKTKEEEIRPEKEAFMTERGFQKTTELCQSIPQAFFEILRHINTLTFAAKPNFTRMRKVLKNEIEVNDFKTEPYDWIKAEGKKIKCTDNDTSSRSEDIKSDVRSPVTSPPRVEPI